VETMCQALVGNYREEHVFALTQALELYDVYQTKVTACDKQIQAVLARLKQTAPHPRTSCFPSGKGLANPMHRRSTPARPSMPSLAWISLRSMVWGPTSR